MEPPGGRHEYGQGSFQEIPAGGAGREPHLFWSKSLFAIPLTASALRLGLGPGGRFLDLFNLVGGARPVFLEMGKREEGLLISGD